MTDSAHVRSSNAGSAAPDAKKLLSVKEVCRMLDITDHTFYAYRKRYPAFRTVKVGNRTYMRPEQLDVFLRELQDAQA